jgi:hypothetical protein
MPQRRYEGLLLERCEWPTRCPRSHAVHAEPHQALSQFRQVRFARNEPPAQVIILLERHRGRGSAFFRHPVSCPTAVVFSGRRRTIHWQQHNRRKKGPYYACRLGHRHRAPSQRSRNPVTSLQRGRRGIVAAPDLTPTTFDRAGAGAPDLKPRPKPRDQPDRDFGDREKA